MIRTASVNANASNMRRRFSTWRKSSLISRIHQNDHTVHPPTDRPFNVVNVNTVRGKIDGYPAPCAAGDNMQKDLYP